MPDNIKKRGWSYIGHILCRQENTKATMTWASESKRKKGRPKETWLRTAERGRQEMGWSSWQEARPKIEKNGGNCVLPYAPQGAKRKRKEVYA